MNQLDERGKDTVLLGAAMHLDAAIALGHQHRDIIAAHELEEGVGLLLRQLIEADDLLAGVGWRRIDGGGRPATKAYASRGCGPRRFACGHTGTRLARTRWLRRV